jgi:hypothetical protein
MQVNNSANSYASLMQYQRPSIPEQPQESPITIPEFGDQEIIGKIKELTSAIKSNLKESIEEKVDDYQADQAEQNDKTRAFLADYAGVQSKKNQWDIYMSVMTESDVDTSNEGTVTILKELRDVQEQNNRVQAYALYQEFGLKE